MQNQRNVDTLNASASKPKRTYTMKKMEQQQAEQQQAEQQQAAESAARRPARARRKTQQEKLEQQAEKRINIQRKQAKVNIDYVKELEEKKASKAKKGQAAGGEAQEGSVLKDSRFDTLFTDPAFTIDRNSEHYQQIKTTMPSKLEQASDDEGREVMTSDE